MIRRFAGWLLFVALLGGAYLLGRNYVRNHPQDVPWTELDLRDPVGAFTGRKLAVLTSEPAHCRALLRQAEDPDTPAPSRASPPSCGYEDGMRIRSPDLRYVPAGLVTSCPVAAGLHLLERRLQFAALRHFNSRVDAIEHFGSYSCRRLYGRSEGEFSEHATADAIDISGFRLADGTHIRILNDWQGSGPKAAFLREVRDAACPLFSTVLSPDYNQAHRDHLHLDQAERGSSGWRMCR